MSASFTSPSRSATLSIPAASFITCTPTPASATSKRLLDPSEQLVKRWQRIGSEIASSRRMSWNAVIALNRQLDIVENLLQSLEPLDEFWRRQEDYTGLGILNNRVRYFEPTVSMVGGNLPSLRDDAPQEMTGSVAKRPISLDDGTIAKRLSNAVSKLQRRQYEFKVRGGLRWERVSVTVSVPASDYIWLATAWHGNSENREAGRDNIPIKIEIRPAVSSGSSWGLVRSTFDRCCHLTGVCDM